MKKTFIFVLIAGLASFTSILGVAKAAEVTEPLYGFSDGNMYDVNGNWKCLFLMDGNCYDMEQNILMTRPATPISTGISTPTTTTETPTTNSTTTDTTTTQSPTLLPAYTEQEVLKKIGIQVPQASGQYILSWPVQVMNITQTSADFSARVVGPEGNGLFYKKVKVKFNGEIVYQNGEGMTESGIRDWVEVNGLTPKTEYQYQFIYSEDGHEDTVITKSFTTK